MFSIRFNQCGYVAIEFVVAMGLLVIPTAMIVLQIPRVLEQSDRVSVLAHSVAQSCANKANNISEVTNIARDSADSELHNSSVLNNAVVVSSSCSSSTGDITPGATMTSNVVISVDAPLVAFVPGNIKWNIHKSHRVLIAPYRSVG